MRLFMTPATLKKIVFLFAVLLSTNIHAEQQHEHSAAPIFSDPGVLSAVEKGWQNKPFQYDAVDADADLVIALGQQSYPIFHQVIHQYGAKNNLNIIVKHGTCGITSGRLRKKAADIGAFCCPPGKSDRLPGLEFHSLGISPIALIVHPNNPLKNVSSKQAREIFRGKKTHWAQLNPDQTNNIQQLIQPIARLHCKVRPGHWRGLLKDEDQFSPRLFEVGVIADMISQVSRNTGAIGYEVPLMISYHQKKGSVRMLDIDGHKATDMDYVLSGQYPLYRSYSLTTWKTASKEKYEITKTLVKYLQQYIEKNYKDINYIPPSQLRRAGWKFIGDELVGEPNSEKLSQK